MTPPPLLVGAGVLFWGWLSGLLIAAVPAAIVIEASRWLSVRIDFQFRDFRRIGDLCIWVLAGLTGYAVLSTGLPHAVVEVVKLLPFALLPLVGAQAYATTEKLNLWAIFRLGSDVSHQDQREGIHSGYLYFVVCLLGAAAANSRSPWFFWVAAFLGVWALWSVRSPRHSVVTWVISALLIVTGGYLGQLGMRHAQAAVVSATMQWFSGSETDPYQSVTDIGHIGELKLSDNILVRLFSDQPLPSSLLLHRASYNSYAAGSWLAQDARLSPLQPDTNRLSWHLGPSATNEATLTLVSQLRGGKGVLSLPPATSVIKGAAITELSQNRLGTVRVEKEAAFIRYEAHYRTGPQPGSDPGARDSKIPASESAAILRLAEDLALHSVDDDVVIETVSEYFQENFRYSIYQGESEDSATPIERFLEVTRQGHCEYFASATVLLLRAAGIPARYATGYSVQEWSDLEQAYIIRQRHAHAWARYYLNGNWHDLDTTPGQWAEIEGEQSSILEPLSDLLSWLRFGFDRWRSGERNSPVSAWWLLILAPLVIYVGWRLRFSKRRRASLKDTLAGPDPSQSPGAGSAIRRIEQHFPEQALERKTSESLLEWIKRLEREGLGPEASQALRAVVSIHYQCRFDPSPVAPVARDQLENDVTTWLSTYSST